MATTAEVLRSADRGDYIRVRQRFTLDDGQVIERDARMPPGSDVDAETLAFIPTIEAMLARRAERAQLVRLQNAVLEVADFISQNLEGRDPTLTLVNQVINQFDSRLKQRLGL